LPANMRFSPRTCLTGVLPSISHSVKAARRISDPSKKRKAPQMIPPCKCGHSRDDHDYGYGTCTNCACERFDEDGSFMECASDNLTFGQKSEQCFLWPPTTLMDTPGAKGDAFHLD
jgi:hypothetical protein